MRKVYIYKEGSAKYGTKCKGELHMITKTYERLGPQAARPFEEL